MDVRPLLLLTLLLAGCASSPSGAPPFDEVASRTTAVLRDESPPAGNASDVPGQLMRHWVPFKDDLGSPHWECEPAFGHCVSGVLVDAGGTRSWGFVNATAFRFTISIESEGRLPLGDDAAVVARCRDYRDGSVLGQPCADGRDELARIVGPFPVEWNVTGLPIHGYEGPQLVVEYNGTGHEVERGTGARYSIEGRFEYFWVT